MSLDASQPVAALPGQDPLADFRRQAAAIVAQERGLSPASRIKLLGIARQMGLTDEQVDGAIRSLGDSAAPPVQANPLVEKFRRRLRKDLSGKERAIIGPTVEAKIVANAARKYSLDEASILKVVEEVTAELGLTRISASDAVASLCEQIEQTTGDGTWLAKEAWDRLRIAGAKWGIELEAVDGLIEERLAANRARLMRQRFATRATLFGTAGTIAVVAVGLLIAAVFRPEREPTGAALAAPTEPATPTPSAASPPTWHDTDLSLAIAKGRTRFRDLGPALDFIHSSEPSERSIGYRKLAESAQAASPSPDYRSVLASILAGSFALDPDDSATRELLTHAAALVPAVGDPLLRQRSEYDAAYWFGELLSEIAARPGLSAGRQLQLAAVAQRELGLATASGTGAGLKTAARQKITARLFEQLTAAAAKNPTETAILHGYLVDLASDLADREFLRLEAALLAVALPAAGGEWRTYEEALYRALARPEPLNTLKLLDAYQRTTDPSLQRELADLLIVASSAKPKSLEPVEVVRAIRQALGASGSAASSTEQERWQALRLQADAALGKPTPGADNRPRQLLQIVELAHLTTLAMALAQGDAGHAVFDAGIGQPPQLAADGESSRIDLPPPRRTFAPLSAKERTDLARMFEQIASYPRLQQVQRESHIRALAAWSEKTGDILPHQAALLAQYVLAPKPGDEQASLVRELAELRRWKRLRLAIADSLEASKLSIDELQQVVGALLAGGAASDAASASELRRQLLEDVVRDLDEPAASLAGLAGSGDKALDRAADLLAETYRARARLFSVGPAPTSAAATPSEALVLTIGPLVSSLAAVADGDDSRYLAGLSHETLALDFLAAGHEPRRTAAVNRVFVELSSRRLARFRPSQDSAARQLAVEAATTELAAANVLVQLLEQERAALRIWMLYAPQT